MPIWRQGRHAHVKGVKAGAESPCRGRGGMPVKREGQMPVSREGLNACWGGVALLKGRVECKVRKGGMPVSREGGMPM